MSEIKVASRYAKSLLDLAIERNIDKAVRDDMQLFADAQRANAEFASVVKNPIIPLAKKKSILHALFSEKVQKETLAFFDIMVNKGRAEYLLPAAREFISQYNIHHNINTVKVVSAIPLTDAAKTEIINKVKAVTGGEVLLNESVDESLIGGVVLTIGDRQFDASVSSKLSQIRKAFS